MIRTLAYLAALTATPLAAQEQTAAFAAAYDSFQERVCRTDFQAVRAVTEDISNKGSSESGWPTLSLFFAGQIPWDVHLAKLNAEMLALAPDLRADLLQNLSSDRYANSFFKVNSWMALTDVYVFMALEVASSLEDEWLMPNDALLAHAGAYHALSLCLADGLATHAPDNVLNVQRDLETDCFYERAAAMLTFSAHLAEQGLSTSEQAIAEGLERMELFFDAQAVGLCKEYAL